MENTVSKLPESLPVQPATADKLAKRLWEIVVFTGVILLSSVAVAAVALAAPLVLAVSALAAFVPGRRAARGWRPVTV